MYRPSLWESLKTPVLVGCGSHDSEGHPRLHALPRSLQMRRTARRHVRIARVPTQWLRAAGVGVILVARASPPKPCGASLLIPQAARRHTSSSAPGDRMMRNLLPGC